MQILAEACSVFRKKMCSAEAAFKVFVEALIKVIRMAGGAAYVGFFSL